jgi:hypothetical protein
VSIVTANWMVEQLRINPLLLRVQGYGQIPGAVMMAVTRSRVAPPTTC